MEEIAFPHFEKIINIFPKIAGPEFSEFHRPFFEKDPKGYGEDILKRLDWSLKITTDEYVTGMRERKILQREMYLKYGLTLRGLIVEKNIDHDSLLNYVHEVSHPEL